MAVSRQSVPARTTLAGSLMLILITACGPAPGSSAEKTTPRPDAKPVKRLTGEDWIRRPTGQQATACDPIYTTARTKYEGEVLLTCSVAADGSLAGCSTASGAPEKLAQISMCLSRSFIAKPEHRGTRVETMVVFREE